MNRKILLAISSALYGASMGAVAFTAPLSSEGIIDAQLVAHDVQVKKTTKSFVRSKLSEKIHIEDGLTGTYRYIVRLKDAPIASYKGDVKGLEATSPAYTKSYQERGKLATGASSKDKRSSLKLNLKSQPVQKYSSYLEQKQQDFLSQASAAVGKQVKPVFTMKNALNAVVLTLTQEQATKLAKLNSVAYVEREQIHTLETDTGPTLIGAPNVWDGTATGVGAKGEGVIIGVIDSGINSDHPSFADIGGDGYDHTNPWGEGVYVGDCAGAFAEMCNDKLIGIRSYSDVLDNYADVDVFGDTPPPLNGEDYNGHGSHTAGTSGGNVLLNVPMLDPEFGEEEGDGINSTGFMFEQVSGVAPHANIVAYQICSPGNEGDTYNGCPGGAIAKAIDDAIADGVDVINYSISGGGFPWTSSSEMAYLAAQDAGIFVAVSAGNSGPDAFTTPKHAPWYTSVAASTHGRTVEFAKTIGEFTGGDTDAPATLNGSSATSGITAAIVYAGDYDNPNDAEGDDSAQCLAAFPAGTFSGEIVICDRGAIARVQKATNVAAGGAGGYVLANLQGEASTVDNDVFEIPGIHIDADSGDLLKTWVSSGTDHMATITAAEGELVIGQADDIAGFSSRGPNSTVPDIMTPSVSAPGVSIYAAYSDQHFGHDVTGPAPTDFAFLQGTSMSSPHVAGAGALLKSAYPTWSPDNIRSALMLTATSTMQKEDGETPADIYDMGSGRINVDIAAQTGLVMDETEANYAAANPNEGGDPKTLNIPSMGDTSCQGVCSWQRTFTATKDATWTTSATTNNSGAVVTVEPATFDITAGSTQTITVTATINGLRTGDQVIGMVNLTSADESIPDANLPLFLTVNTSNIPAKIDIEAHRDAGSVVLRDTQALEITKFTPRVYGLSKLNSVALEVGEDSDNSDVFDDLTDGVVTTWLNLEAASKFMYVGITEAESPDFDLYVGLDANADGIATEDELLCTSATAASNEVCEIEDVEAGNYWVLVQNWSASDVDAVDGFNLVTGFVGSVDNENFTLTTQESADEFTPFDIRMSWDADMEVGDVFIGAFDVATDDSDDNAGNLGTTIVTLTRLENDVQIDADNKTPTVGDEVTYTINVLPNMTDEDAYYNVETNIPKGVQIDADSLSASSGNASIVTAGVNGTNILWAGAREGLFGKEPVYVTTTNGDDASCAVPNLGQGAGYIDLAAFGLSPSTLDGDTVAGTFSVPVAFLGTLYSSATVTDDGFVSLTGGVGTSPWVNQYLPSNDAPNAVIAPLWRDMQLDTTSGSAVYVATAGPTWTIIEFDDMRHYDYYNGDASVDDVLDFEIVVNNVNGDIILAYDNVTHNFGDVIPTTVGWENASGTSGANIVYTGNGGAQVGSVTDIQSGLVICNRLQEVDASAVTITFKGTVLASAAGAELIAVTGSDSTNIDSKTEMTSVTVNVLSNLEVADIEDGTVAEEATLTGIVVEYTDSDTVENTITVSSENGVASNISGGTSGSTFDFTPNEDFVGDAVVTVTVTDNEKPEDSASTSFTVTVTPVNDAPTVTASSTQIINNQVSTITLTAVGSDIDEDDLTYSWTQVSGPSVTLTNANSAVATVENANAETGTLVFEVTVSDGSLTGKATTTQYVAKSHGSGSMGWLLLLLVSAFGFHRKRK